MADYKKYMVWAVCLAVSPLIVLAYLVGMILSLCKGGYDAGAEDARLIP